MEKRNAYYASDLKTKSEPDTQDKYIEGYFAVFGQETKLCEGCYEEIAPKAFDNSIKNNDIRCLFNHDKSIVLGRKNSNTLELRADKQGLWGRVKINPNDSQAVDIYARVERGDISGCSFGFNPINEDIDFRNDGSAKCTILEADVAEISICTFPAYPQTEIQARQQSFEQTKTKELELKREKLKRKLEGIKC